MYILQCRHFLNRKIFCGTSIHIYYEFAGSRSHALCLILCCLRYLHTCKMRCSGTEILLSVFTRNEVSMGASFQVKKRLIKFLCQNPHLTCVSMNSTSAFSSSNVHLCLLTGDFLRGLTIWQFALARIFFAIY